MQHWREYPSRADGTHFTIIVAKLENDADGRQVQHILASLERQFSGVGKDARMHIQIYPEIMQASRQ